MHSNAIILRSTASTPLSPVIFDCSDCPTQKYGPIEAKTERILVVRKQKHCSVPIVSQLSLRLSKKVFWYVFSTPVKGGYHHLPEKGRSEFVLLVLDERQDGVAQFGIVESVGSAKRRDERLGVVALVDHLSAVRDDLVGRPTVLGHLPQKSRRRTYSSRSRAFLSGRSFQKLRNLSKSALDPRKLRTIPEKKSYLETVQQSIQVVKENPFRQQ